MSSALRELTRRVRRFDRVYPVPRKSRLRGLAHAVTLCAFDLLELAGEDLRQTPIELRKATLKGLLRRTHSGVAFNRHFEADGDTVYRHACALGCEGIVSKRLGSPYRPGRVDVWVKIKNPASPAGSALHARPLPSRLRFSFKDCLAASSR